MKRAILGIDDDPIALVDACGQAGNATQCRDTKGACNDGRMRRGGCLLHQDRPEAGVGVFQQFCRSKPPRDKHAALLADLGLALFPAENA